MIRFYSIDWKSLFRIIVLTSLLARSLPADTLTIPEPLKLGKPGTYEVSLQSEKFITRKNKTIKGMFFLPEDLPPNPILLIFYHGSTKDQTYYQKKVGYMIERAKKYKFALLSMQNWWMLSGNDLSGADDSRIATNRIVNSLSNNNLFHPKKVYPIGFSAGGLTAAIAFQASTDPFEDPEFGKDYYELVKESYSDYEEMIKAYFSFYSKEESLYPYAGFGSFKGNFYHGYHFNLHDGVPMEKFESHWQKILKNKIIYLSVGGKDVPRVKKQVPEALEFFKNYLKGNVSYYEYPSEGHALTEKNFKDFWELINQ